MERAASKEILGEARRLAAKLRPRATNDVSRLEICRKLIAPAEGKGAQHDFALRLARLPIDERHYWIGTFYTLLLRDKVRRHQAAYFTPPSLSRAVVALLQKNGFNPKSDSVLDPAAGGAAFLSTIAAQMRAAGAGPGSILKRLHGVEIDWGLARLAEELIGDRLQCAVRAKSIVSNSDALNRRYPENYDLVIANPPFGRLALQDQDDGKWRAVCHSGHINKYALFTRLAFSLVKKSGLVALVLPSSFVAGPLYDKLRAFIRSKGQLLLLGAVVDREEVFVDVAQDISVVIARAGSQHVTATPVSFGKFNGRPTFSGLAAAKLPESPGAPWSVPISRTAFPVGGATLSDYGVEARSGYFVWNREAHRMCKARKHEFDLPLIWARNVRAGRACEPSARWHDGVDFVKFDSDNAAIIRQPAIVIQRTTNSSQDRRIIAARVAPKVYANWGGFVSENHTIVICGAPPRSLDLLCALLNSAAVDRRYRQLSGTASISVKLLRGLDLPAPAALHAAAQKFADFEDAVEAAYLASPRLRASA